jgi:hypothetical protein
MIFIWDISLGDEEHDHGAMPIANPHRRLLGGFAGMMTQEAMPRGGIAK